MRHVDRAPIASTKQGIETRQADLSTPEAAIAATEGAGVIYHAVNVAYHLQVDVMPGIAGSILAAAKAHGARLVVLDTLYRRWGRDHGEHAVGRHESQGTASQGPGYALLGGARRRRVQVVLGRSADFFGPGVINSTLGGAFFPGALTGEPALGFGDISLPHSYSYIRDVARGLATLGSDPSGDGRVWHVPTNPAVSTVEIHAVVQELVEQPLVVEVLHEARA